MSSLTNKVVDSNFINVSDISDTDSESDDESGTMDLFRQSENDLPECNSPEASSQSYVLVTPSQKRKATNDYRSTIVSNMSTTPTRNVGLRQVNLRKQF